MSSPTFDVEQESALSARSDAVDDATSGDVDGSAGDVEDNRPSVTDQPVRPALPALQLDQRELIDATDDRLADRPTPGFDLRRGFERRRELIEWYQRALVRTFGYLAEYVDPADLLRDATLLQGTIVSAYRRRFVESGDPMTLDEAREFRRAVEDEFLLPACNRAYDDLRAAAGEYIEILEDDAEKSPADFRPENQANLAMRPAFSRLDRLQQAALSRLWGGFETEDGLRDWLHSLNEPSNGQVDEDLASQTLADPHAVECLVDEHDDDAYARAYREWYAVGFLLPAFQRAVESMEPGELAKRRKTTAQTYQFR